MERLHVLAFFSQNCLCKEKSNLIVESLGSNVSLPFLLDFFPALTNLCKEKSNLIISEIILPLGFNFCFISSTSSTNQSMRFQKEKSNFWSLHYQGLSSTIMLMISKINHTLYHYSTQLFGISIMNPSF